MVNKPHLNYIRAWIKDMLEHNTCPYEEDDVRCPNDIEVLYFAVEKRNPNNMVLTFTCEDHWHTVHQDNAKRYDMRFMGELGLSKDRRAKKDAENT